MSFSLVTVNNEKIIRQNAPVTDLTGLTSFTQYDVPSGPLQGLRDLGFALGWTGQKIYFLDKPLELTNSISWISDDEMLVLGNDFSSTNYGYALKMTGSNAAITIGSSLGQNRDGSPRYPIGIGLVVGHDYSTSNPVLTTTTPGAILENGASLTVNGSELQFASPLKIASDAGSVQFNETIITDITSFSNSKQTILNEAPSDKVIYTNCVLNAKNYPIRVISIQGIDDFSAIFKNAFIQPHRSEDGNAISSATLVKKNLTFSKNFNTYDIQFVGNSETATHNQGIELTNVDLLPSVDVLLQNNNHSVNHFAIFQEISVQAKDLSQNFLQNCKIRIATFNSNNRVNTAIGGQFQGSRDFTGTAYNEYLDTLNNSSNTIANFTVLTARVWNDSFSFQSVPLEYDLYFESQDYQGTVILYVDFMAYGFQLERQPVTFLKNDKIQLVKTISSDLLITELSASTVSAYPITVTIDQSLATITFAGDNGIQDLTPENAYDLVALYQFENDLWSETKQTPVNRIGDLILAYDYSVFFVSINYTGNMITDQEIVLDANSTFVGTRTDEDGSISTRTLRITNLVVGSRLQIYNITTSTEFNNVEITSSEYSLLYVEGVLISSGDIIRIRLVKDDKEEFTTVGIANDTGLSVLASQVDDQVYIGFNTDGSQVVKFAPDYVDNEIDLVIGSDWKMSELYAWWKYNLTTEDGIRFFFGGITAEDEANFRINIAIVDLFLDNRTFASYKQTDNRRFYRDGLNAYPVKKPTTSGYGLDAVWRDKIMVSRQEKIDRLLDLFEGDVFQTSNTLTVKQEGTDTILLEKEYQQDASGNVSLTKKNS